MVPKIPSFFYKKYHLKIKNFFKFLEVLKEELKKEYGASNERKPLIKKLGTLTIFFKKVLKKESLASNERKSLIKKLGILWVIVKAFEKESLASNERKSLIKKQKKQTKKFFINFLRRKARKAKYWEDKFSKYLVLAKKTFKIKKYNRILKAKEKILISRKYKSLAKKTFKIKKYNRILKAKEKVLIPRESKSLMEKFPLKPWCFLIKFGKSSYFSYLKKFLIKLKNSSANLFIGESTRFILGKYFTYNFKKDMVSNYSSFFGISRKNITYLLNYKGIKGDNWHLITADQWAPWDDLFFKCACGSLSEWSGFRDQNLLRLQQIQSFKGRQQRLGYPSRGQRRRTNGKNSKWIKVRIAQLHTD